MPNKYLSYNLILLLSLHWILISCSDDKKEILMVAVSSNAQFAIEAITEEIEKENDISINLIFGSSGKLSAQIKEGAPYDIFISGDTKYPDYLFSNNLGIKEPKIYGIGSLVIWSTKMIEPVSLNSFQNESVDRIAIANPETAPYGRASLEVLKKQNYFNEIESKLVMGESISQTNQFILTKSVDLGITSKSIVLSPKMKDNTNWIEIDTSLHSPINQSLLILTKSEHSQMFEKFIFSEKGRKILSDFGYFTPE